jgi:hypothetical protein
MSLTVRQKDSRAIFAAWALLLTIHATIIINNFPHLILYRHKATCFSSSSYPTPFQTTCFSSSFYPTPLSDHLFSYSHSSLHPYQTTCFLVLILPFTLIRPLVFLFSFFPSPLSDYLYLVLIPPYTLFRPLVSRPHSTLHPLQITCFSSSFHPTPSSDH